MSTRLQRLRDRMMGRDPADVIAEETYAQMCALPAYVSVARTAAAISDRAARTAFLASVDADTNAAALAYMREPEAARERNRRLAWIRENPEVRVAALKTYYAKHIPRFISDWGMTHDPRLADKTIPFELFERQVAMIDAMLESYRTKSPLSIVKSRDSGASWCAMALLVSLAIFEDGFTAIVGSQLEVKIDQSGTTGTLFHKIRMFLEYLPPEFRGGWTLAKHSANMRVWWPNGSSIQGEAGEAIGRGGRASVVALDEYAHLMHPDLIDQALIATSETKWYISSVNGTDNPFARRVREGKTKVFVYTWKDDPRKTEAWAAAKIAADGQRKFNQEYGCDFLAGNLDQMFPQEHLDVLTDSHVKLKVEPTGRRFGGFDVGNGGDPSAFCIAHGLVIVHVESWPSSTNLTRECRKAFAIADRFELREFCADAVGVGAGIEGIVQTLNAEREAAGKPRIIVYPFKGSEAALFPERPTVPGSKVKVKNYYPNRKSQAYDSMRYRASVTFQLLQGDTPTSRDHVLSISSKIPAEARNRLLMELAQITSEENSAGKLIVDKYGEGDSASPNLADAAAMATAPRSMPTVIAPSLLEQLRAMPDRRGRGW
jgi:phage terminase large subunit